jgi:hypothetical protein
MRQLVLFRYLAIFLTVLVIFAVLSLSGTVGRLFGLEDRLAAWVMLLLGILLALANAIFITRITKRSLARWGGASAYLILVCVIGALAGRSAYVSTPSYIIEGISTKAVGLDIESKSAHFETRAQLKILRSDLHDILWGGLGGTGELRNVTVTRLLGDYGISKTELAGQWQLHLFFSTPPKKGEVVAFEYAFDIIGSEPDNKSLVLYRVDWPTKNLGITIVTTPKARPCKTAEAYSEDAIIFGTDRHEEVPPLLSGDNTQLQWTKTDPQVGRSYIVICHQ